MDGVLKVNPKELQDVRDIMDKDGVDFDAEIDKQLKLVEKLRENWVGEDAETFCNNYHNYLMRMKRLPQVMREMSNIVKDTNNQYNEKDMEFGDELNKEAINYVESEFEDQ
ncbi:MAG: WXG100 family type VII secretion target [Bacilli bacterium]|nr:WXG100 family type VII secretion target [Bacilli bacterium]